jgi:hypothetical protein
VRKLIEVLKRLGLWRPSVWRGSSRFAPASPTLTLSGTCERDVFFRDYLDGVFTESLFRIRAAVSGLAPNSEYSLWVKESPNGITSGGPSRTDAQRARGAGCSISMAIPPDQTRPRVSRSQVW